MAFTRSLLIKALGGVAGVGGTTVGVLAGTGVFNKTETTEPNVVPDAPKNSEVPSGADRNAVDTNHQDVGSREGQGGNESVDSTNLGVSGEVDNKAGKGSTEHEGSDAVSQKGQTGDKTQKVDSGLQAGQPGRDNVGSTTTDSHDTPGTSGTPGSASPNELGNVDNGEVGGGEHSQGSTSQISEPGSSGSPVQVEGAGNVDPKPQSAATTTPQAEEKQKASVVNTGVTGPQQSIPTIQESPDRDSDGQPGGNNGDSNLPDAGATPRTEDAQNLGTGDNGATGGSSGSSDSSTTDSPTQSQEEKINAKLKTLGVPESCNFSQNDTSKTCSISKDQLNQMKFNNGSSVSGSVEDNVENLQLKIEILTGSKKTAYGLNGESEEESDVTKDLLFTFSGFNDEINLESEDSFKLYPNTNPEFKVENDELKLVWDPATNLAEKIGFEKGQGSTNYSLKSGTTTLKYSLDGTEAGIKTLNSPNASGTIYVSDNNNDYNQGVKVTFGGKVTGTESDSLEKGDYEIKYKDGNDGGWYLSKKNEGKAKGSQGTGGEGVNNPEQPQHAQQPDGSPSPNGLSSEQQLNNNQQEQVPVVDTDSHSKTDASDSDTSDTVDNEGDTATDPLVKETNSKLDKLKIPKKCRFTDINKDKPLECSLTKDEFKEISFEDKEVDESLLEENGEPFVMKLIIERLSESKKTDYENEGKQVDLLFTFKDFKEKIENGCKRGFKVNKNLTLDENTNPEFEGNSENFKSLWGQPVYLAKKVGLSEASCNGNGSGCFKFDQKKSQSTKFSVDKGNTIKEVSIPEDSQQKAISFTSARGYSQGFRFLFKEAVTFENNNTLPAGGYEIVYKNNDGWYLSQVSTDTEEHWNEKDNDGKLCVSENE